MIAPIHSLLVEGQPTTLTFQVVRTGGTGNDFLRFEEYIFRNVYFQQLSLAASEGSDDVLEQIEFVYTEMEWSLIHANGLGQAQRLDRLSFNQLTGLVESESIDVGNDRDFDGIDNDWETANGLDPDSPNDSALDLDQDGFDNRAEFLADTDPNDFTSRLKVTQVQKLSGPNSTLIEWSSRPGKRYVVEMSPSLGETAVWTVVSTVDASTENVTSVEIPQSADTLHVFTRVRVAEPNEE